MPRVEIVEKHNTATRRLYIRGHNGKIYAYLIMQESGMGDARREEIVLQLMRMLNHYLTKQKVRNSAWFRNIIHIYPRVTRGCVRFYVSGNVEKIFELHGFACCGCVAAVKASGG